MLQYRITSAFRILLVALLLICLLPTAALATEAVKENGEKTAVMAVPGAAASVLIEANSGQMLFGVHEDIALPPASTTKILTTMLALDLDMDLERKHKISNMASLIGDASLHLRAGEELSLSDLIKGALAHSGNDACFAIGEITAGSEQLFVHWMNMKAAVIGAHSVHAANTNGLPAKTHQMSALDLAKIARHAMNNQFFAETVSSKFVELGEGSSYRKYKNTNKLLWQSDNVVGIKTGTTDAAGKCLVAAYEDGAALFISVVLNSPDRFGESMSLLNYGANNYLLFDLPCGGEYLAYMPDEKQGLFFKAEKNLSVLIEQEKAQQLKLVWRLSPKQGTLSVENSQGEVLGQTKLIPEPDGDK